jgi:4-hydroxy-tetrahydrodipicolinate reductase
VRGGDIVGDHTVLFAGTGERIEITTRAAAAPTMPKAACAPRASWPAAPGLYGMDDVLGSPWCSC